MGHRDQDGKEGDGLAIDRPDSPQLTAGPALYERFERRLAEGHAREKMAAMFADWAAQACCWEPGVTPRALAGMIADHARERIRSRAWEPGLRSRVISAIFRRALVEAGGVVLGYYTNRMKYAEIWSEFVDLVKDMPMASPGEAGAAGKGCARRQPPAGHVRIVPVDDEDTSAQPEFVVILDGEAGVRALSAEEPFVELMRCWQTHPDGSAVEQVFVMFGEVDGGQHWGEKLTTEQVLAGYTEGSYVGYLPRREVVRFTALQKPWLCGELLPLEKVG